MSNEMQKIIDDLETAIDERSKSIMASYEKELNGNIQPRPERLIEMQRSFLEDPIKKQLMKHLCGIMATIPNTIIFLSDKVEIE